MANKEDFRAQLGSTKDKMRELGWDEQGQKNLEGLQKRAFDYGAEKLGVEAGQDANETAGNIVSKLTSGLGTSTAADVLRAGLQTAATIGLDPQNIIAPGAGMRGTVANIAKQNVSRDAAKMVLNHGGAPMLNKIVDDSAQNLQHMVGRVGQDIVTQQGVLSRVPKLTRSPRKAHSELGGGAAHVLSSSQVPAATAPGLSVGNRLAVNQNATKMITGANEIIPRGIKPQNLPKSSPKDPDLDVDLNDLVSRALAKRGQK